MKFPKIDYDFWLKHWHSDVEIGKIYTNKNLQKYINYDGNIEMVGADIFELTKNKKLSKQEILYIIDLIYSWTGPSGRMFYVASKNNVSPREELEISEESFSLYTKGINQARENDPTSKSTFNLIRGIGPSYATKHAHFWSVHSDNPLIILDAKVAAAVGYNTIQELERTYDYTQVMDIFSKESKKVFGEVSALNLERALFAFHNHFFLNNNKKWKNKEPFTDLASAKKLAKTLSIQ